MHCHLGLKDETVKSLGFPVWTGKMVLLNCQFSALSCVDFTVPSPLGIFCRQNGTTLLPIFQLHFALIPLLFVLGFLPVADDSGKTITSIRKSSDFSSF
ncbi:hypothetical protein Peur_069078 [Populus x canadensis]